MTQRIEAEYSGGLLELDPDLGLSEQGRVDLMVEAIDEVAEDRDAAIARLRAGIAGTQFFSKGPLPKREEWHDCP